MKNTFKFGFLALAISLSVAACNGSKKGGASDSTATGSTLTDSSATGIDTSVKDSAAIDTVAKDTTKM